MIEKTGKGMTNGITFMGNGVLDMARHHTEKGADGAARGTNRVFEATLGAAPKVVRSASATCGQVYEALIAAIKKVLHTPILWAKKAGKGLVALKNSLPKMKNVMNGIKKAGKTGKKGGKAAIKGARSVGNKLKAGFKGILDLGKGFAEQELASAYTDSN